MRPQSNLQTRVLKELTSPWSFQWNFRESSARIARRIGADDETVRLTLKRVRERGLVRGWRLMLNPRIVGEALGGLQLEIGDVKRKREAISQVELVDGVALLFDYLGPGLRVVFYHRDAKDRERKVRLISSICGHVGRPPVYWESDMPEVGMRLKTIDWEILRAIRRDPYRHAKLIAAATQTSTRTVNRRLRLMMDARVAYLIPVRDVREHTGVLCSLLIRCPAASKQPVDELLRSMLDRVDFTYGSIPGLTMAALSLDNIAEAEELVERIRTIEGVQDVEMEILREFIFVDQYLDELVERLSHGAAYGSHG